MSTFVTIVGPNLPAEAKATFHVHAEGCADLFRGWHRTAQKETMQVGTRFDVEAEVYYFAGESHEDYELGDWQSEFHFAPCLDSLPEHD
jgi:hypothetical protein